MRTFEDVKTALKKYQEELANEAGSSQVHYVVTGGNMCITKNGGSTLYNLGKGDPIPMIKATADKNLTKFSEKCGDNIKLEIHKYTDWLNDAIKECEHLITCMNKSLSGESGDFVQIPGDTIIPVVPMCIPTQTKEISENAVKKPVEMSCPNCPYSINTCMTCKFVGGVDVNVYPWVVICCAPINQEI